MFPLGTIREGVVRGWGRRGGVGGVDLGGAVARVAVSSPGRAPGEGGSIRGARGEGKDSPDMRAYRVSRQGKPALVRQGQAGWGRRGLLLPASLATITLLSLLWLGGCRGNRTPAEWLQECSRAAEEYAGKGGYLRFRQESDYVLETAKGTLSYTLQVDGEMIFPDRERYELREEVKSDIRGEEGRSNAFSYLTLDGGKTAYVRGERLMEQLGVEGWVHYTPPEGQNRYFDYTKLVSKATASAKEPQWLGFEEVAGVRCAHLAYDLEGLEFLGLESRDGSSLLEGYGTLNSELPGIVLRVELWVGEEDLLPVQMRLSTRYSEEGAGMTYGLRVVFEGYGERPPFPIERPAAWVEAQ